MTLLTSLLCTIILSEPMPPPADPNAWEYTCDEKIFDTLLVQAEGTTLLAVLDSEHSLTLLDISSGGIACQSRLPRPVLRFASILSKPDQRDPTYLVLSSLGGCLPIAVSPDGSQWSFKQYDFITVIDAGIAKADPEFHDRLLETWQRGDQLITLTRMGRLACYDIITAEPIISIKLGPIGACRWVTSPDQLALAWKQAGRVSLMLHDLTRLQPVLIAPLPEATIPQALVIDEQALQAHYPGRRYLLPLLPRFPNQSIHPTSLPAFETPASTDEIHQSYHDFDPAIHRHSLPKATITVYDHRIVLRRTN